MYRIQFINSLQATIPANTQAISVAGTLVAFWLPEETPPYQGQQVSPLAFMLSFVTEEVTDILLTEEASLIGVTTESLEAILMMVVSNGKQPYDIVHSWKWRSCLFQKDGIIAPTEQHVYDTILFLNGFYSELHRKRRDFNVRDF